ncbi:MAG: hybrid sensor histidine kinase/response regulator [Deltaproteobacteria bacterium]|nr:hybrid sensor histidine kinase/response regulator [Deltaproteobacteria bacterium]
MARVLQIEDDPNNRRLVQKLLGAAGHEVIEAEGGVEGIRLARETLPDLVLVDINIPDLDGYEVTLRLRGIPALKDVPIVAITAEADRDSTLAVGCDGFISKPIDAAHFAQTIDRFLKGHREWADDEGEVLLRERTQKIVEHLEKKLVELSETNKRLEDVARLRREFLQNVSHELATPMTPVVGYLRLLLNEELGPLTDLQRKCLGSIETSTQRLRSVVDTLLDVSSLETGRMHYYTRAYDFRDVAENALAQIRPKLEERDVTLVERIPEDPLPALGDPDKLLRAMVHVLDNASKYTPIGGEVAVEVRPEGEKHLLFGVADSGPGVRPEHIARIMEPFYQVDGSVTRERGGVGLGLAFARRVTEALGGGIEISSPPAGEVAERQLSGTLVELRVDRAPDRLETASS